MALSGDTLGIALKAAVDALVVSQVAQMTDAEELNYWKAIGNEIVDHITTSALVSTTVATPDTLTGTGTGTVS